MAEHASDELLQLRAMVAELAGINEIVAAVSGKLAIQQITEILIDKSLRHLQASQGALYLLTEGGTPSEGPALVRDRVPVAPDLPSHLTTFVRRTSKQDRDLPLHLNRNLAAWILKNKRLLVINSPDRDTPLMDVDLPSIGIRTLLAAPLRIGTRVIGLLAAFNKSGTEGFTKQDERFLGILGTQCAQAIEAARLYEEEKRLGILRQDLQQAREIQQRFLPQGGGGVDETMICGFNLPAREVGGDFYEIRPLADGRVFVSVGDVCGKGMPAALLMSNVVAIQHSHLSRGADFSLLRLVENINTVLCHFMSPGQFVCGIFAVYDPARRILEMINAGHPAPVVATGRSRTDIPGEAGLLLGLFPDSPYCIQRVEIPAGSVVCFYTDGITEAANRAEEFYGEERLMQLLDAEAGKSASQVCGRIREEVAGFQGDAPQADDITAVVIRADG